jgi:hypothetical protein
VLDRQSLQPEYRAWRNGTDLQGNDNSDYVSPEDAERLPPREQRKFYKRMRRRVLSFALLARIAIDDDIETRDTLLDLQCAMLGLREWYYGRPKLH